MSEASSGTSSSNGPKWQIEAQDRLRGAIRKYSKPLADLVARDANEGDTRLLVTDFLCDALGFDKYENLTTEYAVKGEFADYGIRVEREKGEKELLAFIEVKRITTKLSERHLRQVEMYAVNEGVEWMILTNGAHWQVFHLNGGLPVQIDLVLDVNLLGDGTVAQKSSQLFYLTKESLRRHQIDELWKAKSATSPKSLAKVLCSSEVLDAIRREIRRETHHNEETAIIGRLLKETVIRPECL